MKNYLSVLTCLSFLMPSAVLAQQSKLDVVGIGLGMSPAQAKAAAAKYDSQMAASVRLHYGRSDVTGAQMGVVLMEFCKVKSQIRSDTCNEEISVAFGKTSQKSFAVARNVSRAKLKTDELIDSINDKYGVPKDALQKINDPRSGSTEVGVTWSSVGSLASDYDFTKCYSSFVMGSSLMGNSTNCPKYIGRILIVRSSESKEMTTSFRILLVDTESVTESLRTDEAVEKAEQEEKRNSTLRGTSKSVL